MATLTRRDDWTMLLASGERGVAYVALAVGGGILALLVVSAGGPGSWNLWSWGVGGFAGILAGGGAFLLARGPDLWVFDRRALIVTPPARRGAAFALTEITAVEIARPRGFGPWFLQLSGPAAACQVLEVGGAIEKPGMRSSGMLLAAFLGVPFIDASR